MVQSINVNASGITRPGVFVNQTYIGGLPQQLASHAVGYIFVSTEADDYFSNRYSEFEPYSPTQIGSIDDYVRKSGGVPTSEVPAALSYHAIKAFFDNAGPDSILYATRVTPTPEVLINIPEAAGVQYRLFTIKINGRYFGSFDMETVDDELVPIKAILTTGIDNDDNAYDILEYLRDTDPDFPMFYEIEQTSTEALNSEFRIYSKVSTVLPVIEQFRAYRLIDSETPDLYNNTVNILSDYPDSVKSFFPIKNLAIRLSSKIGGYDIKYISGLSLSQWNAQLTTGQIADFSIATDTQLSTFLRAYLTALNISVAEGQILAISKDDETSVAAEKFPDSAAGYVEYSASGDFTFGQAITVGNTVARTGYLPNSVQVAYVNIAGENRALISNGAHPDEITLGFVQAIQEVFAEKGLDKYYVVEPEYIEYSNLTSIVPNNGYSLSSNALANHGYPNIKPSVSAETTPLVMSSASTIETGGILTSAGGFSFTPYVGMILYRDSSKYKVSALGTSTTLTITTLGDQIPANSATALPTYVDNSVANGFYVYDYVSNIKITSINGTTPPIYGGYNRHGVIDSNVVQLPHVEETLGYADYKYSKRVKASDYSYAIRQAMSSAYFAPGYIFAPEAFATLVSDGDTYTKTMALEDRIKVIQSISLAAQGAVSTTESPTQSTQFLGLIDCGGDINNLAEASDELTKIKSSVASSYGHLAYYAPYIRSENDIYVPPSAYVASIACNRNTTEGFQQPPAGARYPLRNAIGLKFPINSQQQEITYALGINAIRALPNKGIVVWGARTLSANPLFKFINTRVILNVLIDVLSRSFDDILFEQIDSSGGIYSRVTSIATVILNQFYRQGALFGSKPEQAYAIVCNDSNNSSELLEQGTVRCDIYVATSPTLERIVISVARTPAGKVAVISDTTQSLLNI